MTLPRVLTIAGSDSGGGAGIQADLKTFAAHNTFGMSAITAVTAQNTVTVSAVHPVPSSLVTAQIDAVMDDLGVDAVKIGMLASAELVSAVAETLKRRPPTHVVLDPVMISKSGAALLQDDAVDTLRRELLPLATVVTPNLPEAERLSGLELGSSPSLDARRQAAAILGTGSTAVLIKGGHAAGDEVEDLLITAGGEHLFRHPRVQTDSTHGTGCTLSSAIAARLARGEDLPAAVGGAVDYLQGAIRAAPGLGRGHGPLGHLHGLFP